MSMPRFKKKELLSFVGILLWIAAIVAIGTTAVYRKIHGLTYDDICPEYFQTAYAYVVDAQGQGMDSVLVMLKDISNVNTLYSTFTDENGRFTLFNDFYSFSLYKTPINFEMYVFVDGYADTLIYSFQKKRICHFEKITGPDSIRVIPDKSNYRNVITLANMRPCSIERFEAVTGEDIDSDTDNDIGIDIDTSDMLEGTVRLGNDTLTVALIDRAKSGFTTKESVSIAVDRDGDGLFDTRAGSGEYYETASRPFVVGQYLCMVDRFTGDGRHILLKWKRPLEKPIHPSTAGARIENMTLPITTSVSIDDLLHESTYLLLVFFADRTPNLTDYPDVNFLLEAMNMHLGATEIVWINRRKSSHLPEGMKIIDERQGWEGPVVTRLANSRNLEIVCIDKNRKIIYRGEPGRDAVKRIWRQAPEEKRKEVLARYESEPQIIGSSRENMTP